MDLGAIIAQRRKQAGITIDELAVASGVPKGTLNKIINGNTKDPQLETVKAIARALDCSLDDFDDAPRSRRLLPDEDTLIKKYRELDSYSQKIIQALIEQELKRPRSFPPAP